MNTCAPLSVSLPRRTVGVRRRICLTAIRLYVPSASRWQHASPRDSSLAKPQLPVVHSEPAAGRVPYCRDRRRGHRPGSRRWTRAPPTIAAQQTAALVGYGGALPPARPPGAPAETVGRTLAAVSVCCESPRAYLLCERHPAEREQLNLPLRQRQPQLARNLRPLGALWLDEYLLGYHAGRASGISRTPG
jgi:hypothetical protein